MTQVPPTTSIATGNPQTDEPPTCPEIITSGEREGEVCGRELPCQFHD
jgi:hypothetical protein